MVASIADKVRAELRVFEDLPAPAERRALRVHGRLSQQTVADIVGVSRHAISQWESGARMTPRDPRALKRYVEVLRTLREAA
ncbi:MAG TPA: helix-turn-helix transcriptional regulator [Actinocrinis sp.]|nr:helix-turn-helix transcriptional regulator [Actinocrinis sp.]